MVVADTEANADFLAELGEIPRERVRVCLVGAEDRLFRAGWRAGRAVPVPVRRQADPAARARDDPRGGPARAELPIRLIGSGQLDEAMEEQPENVEWMHWVDYERCPHEYWGAGCALGIFGTSDKALRVIPNKAFQALACGTPLITADTPGARELLVDGESALLVPPGDSRGSGRGDADGWQATRSWRGGSAPGGGRSTRRKRARRCSAPGGGR